MKSSRDRTFTSALMSVLAFLFIVSSGASRASEPVAGFELEIAGVRLLDPEAAKSILREVTSEELFGTTYYQFSNSLRTETITFIQHPGDVRFSIAGVEVDAGSPSNSTREFPQPVEHFTSAQGVVLGMSQQAVKDRLGAPTSESESELRYFYDDGNWLKRYNLPAYEFICRFKGNRLVRFSFGFPYP